MSQKVSPKTGIARIGYALFYSWSGLKTVWMTQAAFRQEVMLLLIGFPVSFILETSVLGKLMMAASGILLLIVELLNSAIEFAIDRSGLEYHILSKYAKDAASAAVFLTFLLTCGIWATVLIVGV